MNEPRNSIAARALASASPATRARNPGLFPEARAPRLQAPKPEPAAAPALDRRKAREGQGQGSPRYSVSFVLYSVSPMDWDNVAASIKPLQDAMVEAGLLPDDGWKVLQGSARAEKVAHKHEERVEIELVRTR